jgi:hypothetical protein
LVEKKVKEIFKFRERKLEELFHSEVTVRSLSENR